MSYTTFAQWQNSQPMTLPCTLIPKVLDFYEFLVFHDEFFGSARWQFCTQTSHLLEKGKINDLLMAVIMIRTMTTSTMMMVVMMMMLIMIVILIMIMIMMMIMTTMTTTTMMIITTTTMTTMTSSWWRRWWWYDDYNDDNGFKPYPKSKKGTSCLMNHNLAAAIHCD